MMENLVNSKNGRLRLFRKSLGLTQLQISLELNLKQQASYANIEKGVSSLTSEQIEYLIINRSLNPLWYFIGEGNMFREVPENASIQNTNYGHIGGDVIFGKHIEMPKTSKGMKNEITSLANEVNNLRNQLDAAKKQISLLEYNLKDKEALIEIYKTPK